jgi:hypothetical protein
MVCTFCLFIHIRNLSYSVTTILLVLMVMINKPKLLWVDLKCPPRDHVLKLGLQLMLLLG